MKDLLFVLTFFCVSSTKVKEWKNSLLKLEHNSPFDEFFPVSKANFFGLVNQFFRHFYEKMQKLMQFVSDDRFISAKKFRIADDVWKFCQIAPFHDFFHFFQMENIMCCPLVTCMFFMPKNLMLLFLILVEFETLWQTWRNLALRSIWQSIVSILRKTFLHMVFFIEVENM